MVSVVMIVVVWGLNLGLLVSRSRVTEVVQLGIQHFFFVHN
jgi:hypothetical protein